MTPSSSVTSAAPSPSCRAPRPIRPASSCTTPSADDPSAAFALSRLDSPDLGHVPMGVFRNVTRPTYDDSLREQVASARTGEVTDADIDALLAGRDTWTVGA